MTYQYKGKDTIAAELTRLQAEAEAREAELQAQRERLRELKAARKRAAELAAKQAEMEAAIQQLTNPKTKLPPPRYGGRAGLAAAAAEAHGYWARKQAKQAA